MFFWGEHVNVATKGGVPVDDFDRLARGNATFEAADLSVLEATDELLANGKADAATWQRLVDELGTHQAMETIFIVGTDAMLTMAFDTWGLAPSAGSAALPAPKLARNSQPRITGASGCYGSDSWTSTALREGNALMPNEIALIERILVAASLPDGEISARMADIGPDDVAEAALAEVASRAVLLNGPSEELVVQCDLGFGGERLGYLLTLGEGVPSVEKGWDGGAAATVKQDLVDLLRELFGPVGPYGATRELFARQLADEEHSPVIAAGTRQLVAAMSQRPNDLSDLAVRFGSDKWGGRWYTPHYQKYFEPYREQAVKVLEIGIGGYNLVDAGGESLRMWKHYFRRGLIYGLDVFEKTGVVESRLNVLQGDQGDEQFLDAMARELGPFDIVIDDGSHISHHIMASFKALFPHVRPGGLYVVEDLASSYWPSWGGDADPSAQYRSMEMIKNLLDDLHHSEQIRDGDVEPSLTELTVTGVHVHHNLAIIEKGLNTEQGAPEWLRTLDHARSYTEE